MRYYNRSLFTPYSWQAHVLENLTDFNVVVGPRQHGKTELGSYCAFSVLLDESIKNPNILLTSDTKDRVFSLYSPKFREFFRGHEHFRWSTKDTSLIKFPRPTGDFAYIHIAGSFGGKDKVKGKSLHYALADEYAKTRAGYLEEEIGPTVSKTGGYCLILGTVEDNHYYDLFLMARRMMLKGDNRWFCFDFKWGDKWSREANTVEELQKMKSGCGDLNIPEANRRFQKDYMCNWFASSPGKIFARECYLMDTQKRVKEVKLDTQYKVGIAMDNGHETAIWFYQLKFGQVFLVDYMNFSEVGMTDIAIKVRNWFEENEAEPDLFLFPHTMVKKEQLVNYKTGLSIFMDEFKNKPDYRVVPKVGRLETKIDATRALLRGAIFDEQKCILGLRSLRNYSRKITSVTQLKSENIDKTDSHGAEALGELAMCLRNNVFDSLHRVVTGVKTSYYKPVYDPVQRLLDVHERNENKYGKDPYIDVLPYLGGY